MLRGMTADVYNALNRQIKLEFEAAFLYLRMSVSMQEFGLPGFAHWLSRQFHEECAHALRLIRHMETRREQPLIPAVTPPESTWGSPLEAFEQVLAHERMVTHAVHELVSLARRDSDFATEQLMMWFVQEQLQEENDAADIVDSLRLGEGSPAGLLRVDNRLAKRAA